VPVVQAPADVGRAGLAWRRHFDSFWIIGLSERAPSLSPPSWPFFFNSPTMLLRLRLLHNGCVRSPVVNEAPSPSDRPSASDPGCLRLSSGTFVANTCYGPIRARGRRTDPGVGSIGAARTPRDQAHSAASQGPDFLHGNASMTLFVPNRLSMYLPCDATKQGRLPRIPSRTCRSNLCHVGRSIRH